MIGMSIRSLAMRFCRSRPLRPGRETSSMRQLGTRTRGRLRNSCADANISGSQPSKRINNSSDSRTETSSSTTNTIGVPSDMEDDWNLLPTTLQFLLKAGSGHSGHGNVEDQTSGLADAIGREKLFRRRERASCKPELSQQVG